MNVTGTDRDAEIEGMIETAICRIEDYCDVSLRSNVIELTQTTGKKSQRLTYIPVESIESVVGDDEEPIGYKLSRQTLILDTPEPFVCRYTTKSGEYDDMVIAVMAFVGLLFDGVTEHDAFNIIRQEYLPSQGFI